MSGRHCKKRDRQRTLGVIIPLEDLVHVLQFLLTFLSQLLLLLLATFDPFQGIVYIAVRITEGRTLELCIEFLLVSYPTERAR